MNKNLFFPRFLVLSVLLVFFNGLLNLTIAGNINADEANKTNSFIISPNDDLSYELSEVKETGPTKIPIDNENTPKATYMAPAATSVSIPASYSICGGSTSVTVSGSGIIAPSVLQYNINGGAWTNCANPFTISGISSTTTIGVQVYNATYGVVWAGPSYCTVTVYSAPSTVAPSGLSPANNGSTTNGILSWSGTLSNHPSSQYRLYINGVLRYSGTATSFDASAYLSTSSVNTWYVQNWDGCNAAGYNSTTNNVYYMPAVYCGTVDHAGTNWTINSNITVSGDHINIGTFTVTSGSTATVDATCHYFNVTANIINVAGTINGNGVGNTGGNGGIGGLEAYNSPDVNCNGGTGGIAGTAGQGTGGGGAGTNGGNGTCVEQLCGGLFCIGNQNGYDGGGGGGGGGAAGTYGGVGGSGAIAAGGNGGSGAVGGTWGQAGSSTAVYGTSNGTDINWGSGGGGAGGGGGAYTSGSTGGNGGNGGGQVALISNGTLTLSGAVYCNGTNGGNGGNASGESLDNGFDCSASGYNGCSICSQVSYDFSGGAGGGAGGGSGGGIKLQAAGVASITGTLQAIGGNGGLAGNPNPGNGSCFDWARGGAGGGGGRIKILINPCNSNTITPTATVAGGTGGNGYASSYNGYSGSAGTFVNNINHPSYTALNAGSIATDQTLCAGAVPSTITNTTGPSGGVQGSYSYEWYSCNTGCSYPTGFSLVSGATGSTYSPPAAFQTAIYVRKVISGICQASTTGTPVTITIISPSTTGLSGSDYVWSGTSSNNWATTSNWIVFNGSAFTAALAKPTTTNNVFIRDFGSCPSNTATVNITESVNNITIESGKTLVLSGSNILNVYGNWINNGTLTPNTGTVVFAGNLSSITTGGTVAGKQFYNVELNSSGTKTISTNDVAVNNNLTLTSGIFDLGNDRKITVNGPSITINGGSVVGINPSIAQFILSGTKTFSGTGGILNVGVSSDDNTTINTGCVLNMNSSNAIYYWTASSKTFSANGRINGASGGILNISGAGNTLSSTNASYCLKQLFYNNTGSLAINSNIMLSGDFINNTTGTINNGANVVISLDGNWTNNGTFNQGTSNVKFQGSAAQSIGGTSQTTFNKLSIYNTSTTGVTLNKPALVNGKLILNDGFLYSSSTNLLKMLDNSTVSTDGTNTEPGSDVSFVYGPMNKVGNDVFTFPTGDIQGANQVWAPIGIDTILNVIDEYQAQYHYAPAINNWSPWFMQDSLDHTSGVEYWDLTRVAGTSNAYITLWWKNATRSGISFPVSLRVAHWNSLTSKWENMGGVFTLDAGLSKGHLFAKHMATSYSPFTFATKTLPYNVLPVELTEFSGICKGETKEITWKTASELNNKNFTLERSLDGVNWTLIATIEGSGTTNNIRTYKYSDKISYEIAYYRLSQITTTDEIKIYDPILVNCKDETEKDILAFPNPFKDQISIEFKNFEDANVLINIYDILGKKIERSLYEINNMVNGKINIDFGSLPVGVYYLEVKSDELTKTLKVVKD